MFRSDPFSPVNIADLEICVKKVYGVRGYISKGKPNRRDVSHLRSRHYFESKVTPLRRILQIFRFLFALAFRSMCR